MDFFRVCTRESRKKGGPIEVYADYTVGRSKDLMVQGGTFYAIWDEQKELWSREAYDVQIIVDRAIREQVDKLEADGIQCDPKYLSSFDTDRWSKFVKYTKNVPDNSHPLDTTVTFADKKTKKTDYASRRLSYSMAAGDISAYEELVSRLYEPEERQKFEWAIGSIIAGDAKKIQKFIVFFGDPGTGKSTIMDLIDKLFGGKVKDGGYVAFFDAQALTGNNNAFATAAFKDNPLVAIQHEGDLSKIETNARLNSIISHEVITVNEKFKAQYDNKINAMLFIGTNKPVHITDAKSGLLRRLIDVNPTGNTHEKARYDILLQRLDFELGAIAHHCLQVYRSMGKDAYGEYVPESMMFRTNAFYNFIEYHFDIFKEQDGTYLQQAWKLYKEYAKEAELPFKLTMIKFREELKNYFEEFIDRAPVEGVVTRSVYRGFKGRKFKSPIVTKSKIKTFTLAMEETKSLLDDMYSGFPAQYANDEGSPRLYWTDEERLINGEVKKPKPSQVNKAVLGDLDTTRLHFLKIPEYHIVIDFDLKDENGEKSLDRNREAASQWPPTYAEVSKSGKGVHLHYIYDGDTSELANEYAEGIEIKVYRGNGSLRRKLTKCNNVAVATINSGLPFREKPMARTAGTLQSEKGLREMILRNLKKEFHSGTKPSIDFIEKILADANKSGLVYDVSDMQPAVLAFANNSTNQAMACIKAVARMDFKSDITPEEGIPTQTPAEATYSENERIVFFDTEVYPNLFVICWKYQGKGASVVRMINPTPAEVEQFLNFKLVGYNNRPYDNHVIWARMLGASNEELYKISQRIINDKDENAHFGAAWNVSYADVYDFASKKQTLKKWEIELKIPHVEMDIPWDKPVPKTKITQVVDYCANDVMALEAVFDACEQDFVARQILADLSGLTVNHSTRQHVMRILFGDNREPQGEFVYTDLSEMFPGYEFDQYNKTEKSTYRGEVVGEGGYVYAEPGIYKNVALLDIASMHPTSIVQLNLFGKYTKTFKDLLDARLAIKHKDFDGASRMFDGALEKHLVDREGVYDLKKAKALSDALKLVVNATYGYTSARFPNPARDPRNIDNIVAKRGALFMIDLKKAVQEKGFTVAHIKTDSIKIPNATEEIIKFVFEFGEKYGYTFEHEADYKKMCLVNDAVYVAKVENATLSGVEEYWTATGAEFKHPFVFKTLFTHEPIRFDDLCETKQVKKGAMYLKFDGVEKPIGEPKDNALEVHDIDKSNPDSNSYEDTHIGRSGLFVPISKTQDIFRGGELVCRREDLGGKDYAVPGTKGYLWAEAEMVRTLHDGALERMVFEPLEEALEGTGSIADIIDMGYFAQLAEDAAQSIDKFGNFEEFVA